MRWLFALTFFVSQIAIANQSCEASFAELAKEYSKNRGIERQVSEKLNSLTLGDGLGSVQIAWDQMSYVGGRDLDQGSFEIRRQVQFEVPMQGALGSSLNMTFLSQGSFDCEGERILAYLGFEIQK